MRLAISVTGLWIINVKPLIKDFSQICCARVVPLFANALIWDITNEWLQSIQMHQQSKCRVATAITPTYNTTNGFGIWHQHQSGHFIFGNLSRWITVWCWHRISIWICISLYNQCLLPDCIYNPPINALTVLNVTSNKRLQNSAVIYTETVPNR